MKALILVDNVEFVAEHTHQFGGLGLDCMGDVYHETFRSFAVDVTISDILDLMVRTSHLKEKQAILRLVIEGSPLNVGR